MNWRGYKNLPYGVFQFVRHKWNRRGTAILIITILALNILGLGFTAYEMNKKGMFQSQRQNSSNQLNFSQTNPTDNQPPNQIGANQSTAVQSQTPKTPQSLSSMTTPYVSEGDIGSINEAYSAVDSNPYWGFKHTGIDFMTTQDLVPFQAVIGGKITNTNSRQETNQQGWHFGFCIDNNSALACYNFETFSGANNVGPKQQSNILVKDNDIVKQGDIVGKLVRGNNGAHLDFGVVADSDRVCPEPYFTANARESIMRLIAKNHPNWKMCYP